MLSELIKEVSVGWPQYFSGKKTNKDSRIHKVIVSEIPDAVKSWIVDKEKYHLSGSDGQGNLLQAPWFAVFNKSITESAQRGYYIVFLFSEDMNTLTLEIGFGATQFKEKYGTGKDFFIKLEKAVTNMRTNSSHLIESSLKTSGSRTNKQEVKLALTDNFNLRSYEKCAIYSCVYVIDNLSDETLKTDFLEYLDLYDRMADSLLLAEVDDYVIEELTVPPVLAKSEIRDFAPRVKKTKKISNSSGQGGATFRRSKKSDKIGKIGEEWVFNFEKEKLRKSGLITESENVIWHREFQENRTPGWDITSYDISGNKIFIEVKSTESKVLNDFILTTQEWEKANSELSKNYYIYLVTNVAKTPMLEILRNPARYVEDGELEIEVASYTLSLYGSKLGNEND